MARRRYIRRPRHARASPLRPEHLILLLAVKDVLEGKGLKQAFLDAEQQLKGRVKDQTIHQLMGLAR